MEGPWFANHIKANFAWWKPFATRYSDYLGDTEALVTHYEQTTRSAQFRRGADELGEFTFCREVWRSGNVATREKLFYAAVLILLTLQRYVFPRDDRSRECFAARLRAW